MLTETRASRVERKLDTVRAWGLGKSSGLRARSCRYDGRVSGAWTCLLLTRGDVVALLTWRFTGRILPRGAVGAGEAHRKRVVGAGG